MNPRVSKIGILARSAASARRVVNHGLIFINRKKSKGMRAKTEIFDEQTDAKEHFPMNSETYRRSRKSGISGASAGGIG